jgi:hypothetical protein
VWAQIERAPLSVKSHIYLRFDWISISLRSCFSTLACTSSDLYRHLRARMNLGSAFVRTMYTLPNFPFPSGRPISNDARDKGTVGRASLHALTWVRLLYLVCFSHRIGKKFVDESTHVGELESMARTSADSPLTGMPLSESCSNPPS